MNRKSRFLGLLAGCVVGGLAGTIAVVLVIIAALAWFGFRDKTDRPVFLLPTPSVPDESQAVPEGARPVLPTPIGYPDTAQDVGTMVGQPAPAFTLEDDTGQPVTVTPGGTGRPTVLIFNMGLG